MQIHSSVLAARITLHQLEQYCSNANTLEYYTGYYCVTKPERLVIYSSTTKYSYISDTPGIFIGIKLNMKQPYIFKK